MFFFSAGDGLVGLWGAYQAFSDRCLLTRRLIEPTLPAANLSLPLGPMIPACV
jgi:hypothetical protein